MTKATEANARMQRPLGDVDPAIAGLLREEAQRQPDHAARMREHPLDRQMRLAGIGRPEHRGDADAACVAGRGPRK